MAAQYGIPTHGPQQSCFGLPCPTARAQSTKHNQQQRWPTTERTNNPLPTHTHTHTHAHTHTHTHTHTHMLRIARQEQSKEKRREKLLRNCRAVPDILQSGKEDTAQVQSFFVLWFTRLTLPQTSMNPRSSSCSILPRPYKPKIICAGWFRPTTQNQHTGPDTHGRSGISRSLALGGGLGTVSSVAGLVAGPSRHSGPAASGRCRGRCMTERGRIATQPNPSAQAACTSPSPGGIPYNCRAADIPIVPEPSWFAPKKRGTEADGKCP